KVGRLRGMCMGLLYRSVGWWQQHEPKTMQKAMQISGVLTDEAVRNGSIKKVGKRENVREPTKNKNSRDDNKRARTGNDVLAKYEHVVMNLTCLRPPAATVKKTYRTLMINLVFTLCEEQTIWNSVLMRLIDDILALDSIVRFGFSDQRLEQTATFSILTNSK
nr:hypothetical protein [Tanacetum cinerariifolium]